MHVGMTTFFQNLAGHGDAAVYEHELGLASSAEGLGFDSIWAAEHHFDGYTMCPNVGQFLAFMAGRTRRVKLGSMVCVLPWHHPVRVAEDFATLDQLSGGRAVLGMGRGLGAIEFNGFGVDMNESRERFVEYAEAILTALDTGVMEYEGRHLHQSRVAIRPAPLHTFRGRAYASAVSPESARIMARLKVGLLIIAQKPWEKTVEELEMYRSVWRELNPGEEPPRPLMVVFVACHESEAMAEEMRIEYLRGYSRSALEHYEFDNPRLAEIRGYEYYGALSRNIAKHGVDAFVNFLADLQVWGTPAQVTARLLDYRAKVDAGGFIMAFSYGGMPFELARANMNLFARKVLPVLQAHAIAQPASAGAAA